MCEQPWFDDAFKRMFSNEKFMFLFLKEQWFFRLSTFDTISVEKYVHEHVHENK